MRSEREAKTLLGRFWLPSAGESASVSGVLEFNSEGAAVRLEGSLSGACPLADAIVFARFPDTGSIATLYNCFGGTTIRNGEITTSRLTSTLVAMGCHLHDLSGHGIQFRLATSAKWFHEQTFDTDVDLGTHEAVVRFTTYKATRYRLTEDLELDRYYGSSIPGGNWGAESFRARRPMGFRIFARASQPFDNLWNEMTYLRRLLEFLSQHPMPHKSLHLYARNDESQGADISVHHPYTRRVKEREFEWGQQLIAYPDLGERFTDVLQRWFDVRRRAPEPFERYFMAFDRHGEDAILHFLWNAAALEELHKLRTSRKKTDLLIRLKDIRSRWAGVFEVEPTDAVLEEIRDTRHYYAHAAGDLRDRAAKDWVLLRYGYFLAALSNLELLSMLGFSDEEIGVIARKHWMRETLALKLFPRE